MAINYAKAQELFLKGLGVEEIAKKLKCSTGALNNNVKKWKVKIPVEEDKEKMLSPQKNFSSGEKTSKKGQLKNEFTSLELLEEVEENNLEVISETTEREILQVKRFYKSQMKIVRTKIKELLGEPYHEETIKEIGLLTKLIELLGKSQKVDWAVYDILEYKDLVAFEIAIKKLETEFRKRG